MFSQESKEDKDNDTFALRLAMDNLNLYVYSQSTLSLPVGKKKSFRKWWQLMKMTNAFSLEPTNGPNKLDYFDSLGYKDMPRYTHKRIGPIRKFHRK